LHVEPLERRNLLAVHVVPAEFLAHDEGDGLSGSYVDQSLRGHSTHDDWRDTQPIAGTRIDKLLNFASNGWGLRAPVGITGGSNGNWEDFSVQWDGYITIPVSGTRLYTRSDDGSRMWIDVNDDGAFSSSGDEFVDNHWGSGQDPTTSGSSAALAAGTYRIRVQYEEGNGGNQVFLGWNDASHSAGLIEPTTIITEHGSIDSIGEIDEFILPFQAGETVEVRPLDRQNSNINYAPSVEVLLPDGSLLAGSCDGHSFEVMVPETGDYVARISSDFVQRGFTGSYSVTFLATPFDGTSETEYNNRIDLSNDLTLSTSVTGKLATTLDQDWFRFSGTKGQIVAVKWANLPARNPAVQLFNNPLSVLASGLDGNGLVVVLPASKSYYLCVSPANTAGKVTGRYVGSITIIDNGTLESPSGDAFDHAAQMQSPSLYLVPDAYLHPAPGGPGGLMGNYVNECLGWRETQDDWRTAGDVTISGTRVDSLINFPTSAWGVRADVGITGGSDDNWDDFSVQWDGFITIPDNGTRLFARSDDGSRMWIDLNHDNFFNSFAPEFIDNDFTSQQASTTGPASVPLDAGTYRIRIQYQGGSGENEMYLLWDDEGRFAAALPGQVVAAAGILSSPQDVDVFAIELEADTEYVFRLEDADETLATQERLIAVCNAFGQLLAYGIDGDVSVSIRQASGGRHLLAVRSAGPVGLGGYVVTAEASSTFPTQRDVPLYYFDFDGGTYWGWEAAPFQWPEAEPVIMGMFEAVFRVNDIYLTTTQPPAGTERAAIAIGDVRNPPFGGWGGGWIGDRRPSGDAICDVAGEAGWTRHDDASWAYGISRHEGGHATGFLPHTRHPLDVMDDGETPVLPPGEVFPSGEDPLPTRDIFRERDYLDWITQAGRYVSESEPNDTSATAQNLDPFIVEMSGDADARNDKVVVPGLISDPDDVDTYRITAETGQSFSFDIDAAEFQSPLDATLRIYNASGTALAGSTNTIDRETGIDSVDPYLAYRFDTAGTYYVQVRPVGGTWGNYRLKVAPDRAWDSDGPRVLASWPDGGQAIDATRQLVFWFNEQLDPATLTAANLEVRDDGGDVSSGSSWFDPADASLTWQADEPLASGNYTVTLGSGSAGMTDLYGNPLDGETAGTLYWPDISGDGVPGGDFVTTFSIAGPDNSTAQLLSANYRDHFNFGLFTLLFNDEIDYTELFADPDLTLRSEGADGQFDTDDDQILSVHLAVNRLRSIGVREVFVYTFGVPEPGLYRVEGTVVDAAGHLASVSETVSVGTSPVPTDYLQPPDESGHGLVGSYVNENLRDTDEVDWRSTQTISGTRTDAQLDFYTGDWGQRTPVGITGGTDDDWEDFSVQWDGWITVPVDGTHLFTRSDDGSRMWIDVDDDGAFSSDGEELVNNNWGNGQNVTTGPASVALDADTYRIRIQYEEGYGGNEMHLLWTCEVADAAAGGIVRPTNVAGLNVQPGTVLYVPADQIEVKFSGAVDTDTLTVDNFRLRYSPDTTFFDGNDTLVADADGLIAWDPAYHRATLQPATPLANGYYLLELNGSSGGITDPLGRLLDGEYLDATIQGSTQPTFWQNSPSGDGLPGGDYRAFFAVRALISGVVVHHVFYNNSHFDGDPSEGRDDDNAIAPDPASASHPALGKTVLLPGGTATFHNYTSYSGGINGIMVDIANLANAVGLDAADFEFRVSNRNNSPEDNTHDPSTWGMAPAPTITVREDAGTGGSDRVMLIWDDRAIYNQWLQVTVKANARTGLGQNDVFYVGNAIGECGDATAFTFVDGADFAGARDNTHDSQGRALIEDRFDYNRDSLVDQTDLAIARDNHTNFLTCLTLFTAPAVGRSPSSSPFNSSSLATVQLSEVSSLADYELGAPVAISGSDWPTHFLVNRSYLRPTTRQPVDLPKQRTADFDPQTVFAVLQEQETDGSTCASDSALQTTRDRWLNAVDDFFLNDDSGLFTW